MVKVLLAIIIEARPRQWVKNLGIFTSIIFTGQLFNVSLFQISLWAFVIFCALSSATYIFNDIIDIKRDRMHPVKKLRPIAAGTLPINVGLGLALVLVIWGLSTSLSIGPTFFIMVILYLLLQFFYSLFLKHLAVLDILAVASGYIIRVMAGEFATGFHVAFWLLICVISASLFLAIGKRRAELTSLSVFKESTRPALGHYSEQLLDMYLSMFASATWFSYALFTFLQPPIGPTSKMFYYLEDVIPAGLTRKWLVVTIPFVIYGLMRYTQLIFDKKEGENPEKVVLGDKPLLVTIIIWISIVIILVCIIGR